MYGYAFTSFAGTAQEHAPDEMRGRVLAVNAFVLGFLYPVGALVQGQLADAVGLRWVTAGSGILLALCVGAVFARRALRPGRPGHSGHSGHSAAGPAADIQTASQ